MYGVDIAVGPPNLPSYDNLHMLLHPGSLALWLVGIYLPFTPLHSRQWSPCGYSFCQEPLPVASALSSGDKASSLCPSGLGRERLPDLRPLGSSPPPVGSLSPAFTSL